MVHKKVVNRLLANMLLRGEALIVINGLLTTYCLIGTFSQNWQVCH